ncbi:MAG: zinc-ribbon domain-containing protein [Acidaminococcaceae bacterium]|nr:zinc-ribbon domain-containing protein [Acidaminococcaceae bacterium]
MFCKNCFRQLSDGARFCNYCGQSVEASAGHRKTS